MGSASSQWQQRMKLAIVHVPLRQLLLGIEIVGHHAARRSRTAALQPAVAVAVREIDDHPDQEPDSEAIPRLFRQVLRQEDARESAQNGEEPRAAGNAERALAMRVFDAQDDDADADEQ